MLSTKIGHLAFESCLMNASGARCMQAEELHALGQSQAGGIVSKSCTLAPRLGNPSPRYHETEWGSINSMGLPNEGWAYYADLVPALRQYGKPYWMSVSGLSLEENLAILDALIEHPHKPDAVELNLSCPNVVGKPQTGYDMEQVARVLDAVFARKLPFLLGVKLPPYFDLVHFEQAAAVLKNYPLAFVTCVNSIGNGLVIDLDAEAVVIKPKGGFGGIGGDYIKPTALANVRQFRLLLPPEIAVIGCGGIKTGGDVMEHLLCGASAIQIGTQLMREDVGCFERIEQELRSLLQRKGYQTIAEVIGRLKTLES